MTTPNPMPSFDEFSVDEEQQAAGVAWSPTQQAQWGFNPAEASVPVEHANMGGPAGVGYSEKTAEREGADAARAYDPNKKVVVPQNIASVVQWINGLNGQGRTQIQATLKAAGYLPGDYSVTGDMDKKTVEAFVDMLGESSRYSIANPGTAWQDYLLGKAQRTIDAEDKAPRTQTRRDVTRLSYDDPGGFFDAFQQAVGRAPTDSETKAFVDTFNAKAEKNPQVTTQTTDPSTGNVTATTTGGIDVGSEIREQAMENPDYANYQAVATYFPAMERALGAIGGA